MSNLSNDNRANNKRIAKNTIMLYVRMLLLMFVSLYTSRVNLSALGVDDFGIYHVVGGVVTMFYIVSNALTGSINRFLTIEIGKGDIEKLKRVFATSMAIQYILVFIVLVLAETGGLWFLNNKMVIPYERLTAANWVFQFSLFSFCLDLLVIPYTSSIIAHERMSAFAYISIFQAFGKLFVAWSTYWAPFDKLIWFSCAIVLVSVIVRSIYIIYCKRNFVECCVKTNLDKELRKEMFGFAGWNFIGTIASILRDYGGNIVINLFGGPAVNAARGIASQVNSAVSGFSSNFQTALKPQITKNYAIGNFDYMFSLVFQGARLSYYILFILALPILCSTHYILQLWLGQVPEHTVLFVQLVLIFTMSESLAQPLITVMLATGKIRNFQIIVGGLNLLNVPISYCALSLGAIPETVMIVAIAISVSCEMARVILLKGMIDLPIGDFFKKVYFNVIGVSLVAAIIPLWLHSNMDENFLSFLIVSIVALICSLFSIYIVGCNRKERIFVYEKVSNIVRQYKSK